MPNEMITITGMSIGGHSVPVPHGLSELLDAAGAWSTKPVKDYHAGYHREVVMKDGKLMTILTKIAESS